MRVRLTVEERIALLILLSGLAVLVAMAFWVAAGQGYKTTVYRTTDYETTRPLTTRLQDHRVYAS